MLRLSTRTGRRLWLVERHETGNLHRTDSLSANHHLPLNVNEKRRLSSQAAQRPPPASFHAARTLSLFFTPPLQICLYPSLVIYSAARLMSVLQCEACVLKLDKVTHCVFFLFAPSSLPPSFGHMATLKGKSELSSRTLQPQTGRARSKR